jgi:hypothetical protein
MVPERLAPPRGRTNRQFTRREIAQAAARKISRLTGPDNHQLVAAICAARKHVQSNRVRIDGFILAEV